MISTDYQAELRRVADELRGWAEVALPGLVRSSMRLRAESIDAILMAGHARAILEESDRAAEREQLFQAAERAVDELDTRGALYPDGSIAEDLDYAVECYRGNRQRQPAA